MIVSFLSVSNADHYEAAMKLAEVTKEINYVSFIDSLVKEMVCTDTSLSKYKQEIQSMLYRYVNSPEYKEVRAKAIMHYFTEPEIIRITQQLRSNSFTYQYYSRPDDPLSSKYLKTIRMLKAQLLEYLQWKMNRIYNQRKK